MNLDEMKRYMYKPVSTRETYGSGSYSRDLVSWIVNKASRASAWTVSNMDTNALSPRILIPCPISVSFYVPLFSLFHV